MTTALAVPANGAPAAYEMALVANDLSKLSTEERLGFYRATCESLGLNPLTQPFSYLTLNGKLTLYAKRDATDQLRKLHRVTVAIVARDRMDDVYVVTARATLPDGRSDESIGAVPLGALKGDALANALMKAETKAKRRVTLSICGLGWLDESEVETIPDAQQHIEEPAKARAQTREQRSGEATPKPPRQGMKFSGEYLNGLPLWLWSENGYEVLCYQPKGKQSFISTTTCPEHGKPFGLRPDGKFFVCAAAPDECSYRDAVAEHPAGEWTEAGGEGADDAG